MKKVICILVSILFTFPSLYSQDTIREVSLEQLWMQDHWANYERITTLFINKTLPIKSHLEIWDKDHYISYSLVYFKYDENYKLIEQLIMAEIENRWVNARLTEYQYTSFGKIQKTTLSFWEDENWEPNREVEYIYDDENYLIKVNRYTWKDKTKNHIFSDSIINNEYGQQIERITKMYSDIWENEFRFLYEFKDSILTTEIQQYWQFDNWVNNIKIEYDYTGSGKNRSVTYYRWTNQQWAFNYKYEYEYYPSDLLYTIIEYVWIAEQWSPKRKEVWSYNDDGKIKEYYIYVWFDDLWGNYGRFLYDYFTNIIENKSKGKLEYSILPNPTQDFIIIKALNHQFYINQIRIYDIDGKMVKSIMSPNFDYSQFKINISELAGGSYLLLIETNDGLSLKKFIKSK